MNLRHCDLRFAAQYRNVAMSQYCKMKPSQLCKIAQKRKLRNSAKAHIANLAKAQNCKQRKRHSFNISVFCAMRSATNMFIVQAFWDRIIAKSQNRIFSFIKDIYHFAMDALFCLKNNFIVIYHKLKCFLMFFLRDFSKFMIESFI